ncbi:MAG: glycosyltransferase family 4 protein [Mariprofundaceae bacterium]|nr:glycosyltransferase family 4 protein [Mariprofundaceae bacterium]
MLSLWLASENSPLRILDSPNARSLHEHPTPRTGGVAIIVSAIAGWGVLVWYSGWPAEMRWVAFAALLTAAVSFTDDVRELSAGIRLAVHALAAAILIAGEMVLPWGWFGTIITFLAIIWALNLYNFMDGMDGFAGGMAVFGFGFLGLAGSQSGNGAFAWYSWMVAASALGFLLLNFPPARIFMGDAGSATLGLLAAGFSLWGIHAGLFSLWLPLLVFSPFVVDATVTLLRRALRGDRVWQAHRTHYYQRLVRAGWGHRKTVLAEYALMLAAGGSAILMQAGFIPVAAGLIGWAIIFILLARVTDRFCADKNTRGEQ